MKRLMLARARAVVGVLSAIVAWAPAASAQGSNGLQVELPRVGPATSSSRRAWWRTVRSTTTGQWGKQSTQRSPSAARPRPRHAGAQDRSADPPPPGGTGWDCRLDPSAGNWRRARCSTP